MEKKEYDYIKNIEKNDYKDFDSFFESDEFNTIENEESQRKIFYYFALKFSAQENRDIISLYEDLKNILDKIQSKKYLKYYDKEIYIKIIENFLEKIEIFNARHKFYHSEENIYAIRDIIKQFKNIMKMECPLEIYESLEDFYDIILIKKKHKIPLEHQDKISRYLKDYKSVLDDTRNKLNKGDINKDKEKDIKINEEKNINNNINIFLGMNKNEDKYNIKIKNNKENDIQNINKMDNLNINNNFRDSNIENDINKINNFDDIKNDKNQNLLNNFYFNNIFEFQNFNNDLNENIKINNQDNFPDIFNNENKIYKEEGLGFVKNLLKEIENNKEKDEPIKEDKKIEEKGYTNEIEGQDKNKYKNLDNPFKKKKEDEKDNEKQQNLNEQTNTNSNKKKKKKKKNKEEKVSQFMAYAKKIDINDI